MKRLRTVLIVITILSWAIFSFSGGGYAQDSPAQAETPPLIRLQWATFDPLQGEPSLPAGLRIAGYPQGVQGYYLVQFRGPVHPEWKQAVEAAGVRLFDYIPDFAFIARMDEASQTKVAALPFVRWVGLYQPAYKLSPALEALAQQGETEPLEVVISSFPGEDLDALASVVTELGGTVVGQAQNPVAGYIHARLPGQAIGELLRLPAVSWIEPYYPAKIQNDTARQIMGVTQAWQGTGLFGAGQIVAVADTGLDIGITDSAMSDDFEGRIVKGYTAKSLNPTCTRDAWSDIHGHGTHVTGSVLGNGRLSGSNPTTHSYAASFAGVAPEAQVVVQALDDGGGRVECAPTDSGDLMRLAYNDRARIHTNSWGGQTGGDAQVPQYGGYDSEAQQVDQAAWEHKDMLILFAAGNDGQDAYGDGRVDPDSIESPGTAKNVLTVGASENNRPPGSITPPGLITSTWSVSGLWGDLMRDDYRSDNPNGMAGFSSRGPTDDGRLKPDVVAPGTNIISARSHASGAGTLWAVYNADYAFSGGTSMSTPLTAGAAAVVRQWYNNVKGLPNPSGALIKATLINGAVEMSPGQYSLGAGAGSVVFSDGFEGSLAAWQFNTSQGASWTQVSGGHDSSKTMRSSASGPYPNNADIQMWTISGYNLTRITNPALTFWHRYDLERDADGGLVYISTDGGRNWTLVAWFTGTALDWGRAHIDLRPYARSSDVKIMFRLLSDSSEQREGWYIDDVRLQPREAALREIGPRPDNAEGWGRVNLRESIAPAAPRRIGYMDNTVGLSTGQTVTYTYKLDSGGPFRATLAWTDYPGNPAAASALVNNLDLEILAPDGTRYRGNGGADFDRINNVEGVILSRPRTGTYQVIIRGFNVPQGPQPYALVVSGDNLVLSIATRSKVHLPALMKNWLRPGIPTPTPTRTPGGPTPTRTPTATRTPSATRTATPVPGGIWGRVTEGGAPAAGVELWLRFYDGSNWSTRATTRTAGDGRYSFTGMPGLGAGQMYYVQYPNVEENTSRLNTWYSYRLTTYAAGANVPGGDFDIKDVALVSPASGATVTLPATFSWRRRQGVSNDSYRWVLVDPNTGQGWISDFLGDVESFTLTDLPSGAEYGRRYNWYLQVYNQPQDEFNYGTSYYYRIVALSR